MVLCAFQLGGGPWLAAGFYQNLAKQLYSIMWCFLPVTGRVFFFRTCFDGPNWRYIWFCSWTANLYFFFVCLRVNWDSTLEHLQLPEKLWLAWSPPPNNSENETNSDNGWSPASKGRGPQSLKLCCKRASNRWVWTTWSTRHPMRCISCDRA